MFALDVKVFLHTLQSNLSWFARSDLPDLPEGEAIMDKCVTIEQLGKKLCVVVLCAVFRLLTYIVMDVSIQS